MRSLRIFISSPGDVAEEREKAKLVIDDLQRRYDGQVNLIPVLWEDLAIPATAPFQVGIDSVVGEQHRIDIAVFILWSRLGSPIGPSIRKPDGSDYLSGTEREFDLMLGAFERSGGKLPILLAYTRRDDEGFNQRLDARKNGDDALEEILRQRKLVRQFIIERFHDSDGRNLRAYHSYREPVSFARRLHVHLRGAIDDLLELEGDSQVWTESPYRSLEAFDICHAPIFFGRDEETCDVLQQLRDQEAAGCAFVCIVGSSGSGKSSLARAGVASTLLHRSYDNGIKEWRGLAFFPGQESSDLLAGLSRLLAEPLEELHAGRGGIERFTKNLREGNLEAASLLLDSAFDAASRNLGGPLRLLLILDQMEELWTDRRIATEQREKFLGAVESLARGGNVSVLATLRSDFYPQAQLSEIFLRMKGLAGHFDLTPPGPAALRSLILQPAHRSGARFEREEHSGRPLDERILEDAARDPSALPLLQYALAELYEHRDQSRRMLTYAAYEAIGGVEGALGRKADQTYTDLAEESRNALEEILPELVSVDTLSGQNAVRRRALLVNLTNTPERRYLTEAMIRSRLLTTDAQEGVPTVTLAHEALLRRWNRISDWINRNYDLLRMRATVEQHQAMWEISGRDPSRLLPKGLPLEEGREVLENRNSILGEATRDYVLQSADYHFREEQRSKRLRRVALATLSAMTVISLAAGLVAWEQRSRLEVERNQQENLLWTASNSDHEVGMREFQEGRQSEALLYLNRALEYRPTNTASLLSSALQAFGKDALAWRARDIIGGNAPVLSSTFKEHGKKLCAVFEDGFIREFNVDTGDEVSSVRLGGGGGALETQGDFSFSPDGGVLAHWQSGSLWKSDSENSNALRVFDTENGRMIFSLEFESSVKSVEFSPNGRLLLADFLYYDKVQVIDTSDGNVVETFEGAELVTFSTDGEFIGLCQEHSVLRVVTSKGFSEVMAANFEPSIKAIKFSPDGRFVAAVDVNATLKIMEIGSGAMILESTLEISSLDELLFSPDGTLLTCTSNNQVHIISSENGVVIASGEGRGNSLNVSFSPDGRLIAVRDIQGVIIMDSADGKEVATLPESYSVTKSYFSPDGRFLAVEGGTGLLLFEPNTEWELNRIQIAQPSARIDSDPFAPFIKSFELSESAFALSPDGRHMAVGTYQVTDTGDPFDPFDPLAKENVSNSNVRFIEPVTGKEAGWIDFKDSRVLKLQFSPDGRRLLALTADNIGLFDVPSGNLLFSFDFESGVNSAVFSPQGTHVAVAGEDQILRIFDVSSGAEFARTHYAARVGVLAYSPDGRFLAISVHKTTDSGGVQDLPTFVEDCHTIVILDPMTGIKISEGKDLGFIPSRLRFSYDGRFYAVFENSGYNGGAFESLSGERVDDKESGDWLRYTRETLPFVRLDHTMLASIPPSETLSTSGGGKRGKLPVGEFAVFAYAFNCSPDGRFMIERPDLVYETSSLKSVSNLINSDDASEVQFDRDSRLFVRLLDDTSIVVEDFSWFSQLDPGLDHAWLAAMKIQIQKGFSANGLIRNTDSDDLAEASHTMRHFIKAAPSPQASWQHAILSWALQAPELRMLSPWCDELLRVKVADRLMNIQIPSELIEECADRAPWHPLEPVSLARLEPMDYIDPFGGQSVADREKRTGKRSSYLARLTIERLRSADEGIYGRSTLAEYAAWSAKIMLEELGLRSEALEAIDFALERATQAQTAGWSSLREAISSLPEEL